MAGADPLPVPRGQSDRRLRALRGRERNLRLFRRFVPRHASDRPVVQRERGDPLGQRLHRRRLRLIRPKWRSRSTAARPGRASGGPPGSTPGPGTITRGHVRSRRATPTSRRDSTTSAFFGLWWQVDDVAIGPVACSSLPGGLVVGSVSNANTGLGAERRHGHGPRGRQLDDDRARARAGRRLLHALRRGQRLAGFRGGGRAPRVADEERDDHAGCRGAPRLRARGGASRREPAAPVGDRQPRRLADRDARRHEQRHR